MRGTAIHDKRCSWVNADDPLLLEDHDREWGVPVHGDREHLEVLVLSGAQAGLNRSLVLKNREGYRRAFDSFDPAKVARYSEKQIQTLLADPSIIRNRMKIEAALRNARALLTVREEFRNFVSYCWRFIGGQPKLNRWKTTPQIPATSVESETFSWDLTHRIQFRRADSYVCVYASCGNGKRSACRMFPLSRDHTRGCRCKLNSERSYKASMVLRKEFYE